MSVQLTKALPSAPQVVLTGTLKGVYAAGTDYAPGDVVTYQGGTYIMHTDAAAGTAPTDTAAWQAINSPQGYVESIDTLSLVNATTDNTLSIDQNGNVGTDVATDGAVHIENTGNTGIGLGVYTNIGAEGAAALVSIKADNVAFTQTVVNIVNDGTGNALRISQVGALATNTAGIYLINQITDQTTGYGLLWVREVRTGSSIKVVKIQNAGIGTTLLINNDGAGRGILVDHDDTGNLASVEIDRDGANANTLVGLKITVDNTEAGAVVAIDVSGMSNDETVIKLNSTLNTTLSTKSPETDAEAGWFAVMVGSTQYAVFIYALS